jgi:hypothetical protein
MVAGEGFGLHRWNDVVVNVNPPCFGGAGSRRLGRARHDAGSKPDSRRGSAAGQEVSTADAVTAGCRRRFAADAS